MINAIINGILGFVTTVVGLVTSPIDSLINSTIPQFNSVLNGFSQFLNYILGFIPWGLSWFHIPNYLLTFLVLYIISKITISQAVHAIKIALAWWRTLKP